MIKGGSLTTLEASIIEANLLPSILLFFEAIFEKFDYTTKPWNAFLNDFLLSVDRKDVPLDDTVAPLAESTHYILLLIFDFSFIFNTNFVSVTEIGMDTSFSGYKELMTFFSKTVKQLTGNQNGLLSYIFKANSLLNSECNKTEYRLQDYFSLYGYAFMLFFESSFTTNLPLIYSKQKIGEIYEKTALSVLSFERNNRYCTQYYELVNFFTKWLDEHLYQNNCNGTSPSAGRLLLETILAQDEQINMDNLSALWLQEEVVVRIFEYVEKTKEALMVIEAIRNNKAMVSAKGRVKAFKLLCFEAYVNEEVANWVKEEPLQENEIKELQSLAEYAKEKMKNETVVALIEGILIN